MGKVHLFCQERRQCGIKQIIFTLFFIGNREATHNLILIIKALSCFEFIVHVLQILAHQHTVMT